MVVSILEIAFKSPFLKSRTDIHTFLFLSSALSAVQARHVPMLNGTPIRYSNTGSKPHCNSLLKCSTPALLSLLPVSFLFTYLRIFPAPVLFLAHPCLLALWVNALFKHLRPFIGIGGERKDDVIEQFPKLPICPVAHSMP